MGGGVKRSLGAQSLLCPRGSDVLWPHFTPHAPVLSVESRTWAGGLCSGTSSPRTSSQSDGKARDPEVQDPRPGSPRPAGCTVSEVVEQSSRSVCPAPHPPAPDSSRGRNPTLGAVPAGGRSPVAFVQAVFAHLPLKNGSGTCVQIWVGHQAGDAAGPVHAAFPEARELLCPGPSAQRTHPRLCK